MRKTTIKSKPGCLFPNRIRKLAGGVRVNLGVGGIGLKGTERRKVRRVLYWTMHLRSNAGWEAVYDGDAGDFRGLPYGGSNYTQSGTVTFARTYYPRVKARRIWQSNFDAYFNICLNSNRKVRAKGGQLYCWATVGRRAYWNTTMSHKDDL